MNRRLKQQIDFILEADKLKNVIRRNYLSDDSRRENTAEHTWHTMLTALLLYEYAENKQELNLLHVLKMIAIHDLVEIEAGDTFMFDTEANKHKFDRENQAAKKIFSLLPYDQGKEYYDIWQEFEKEETPDAIFAASVDKIMPVLLNTYSKGTSWQESQITAEQVHTTLKVIDKGPRKVKELLEELVTIAKDKGQLI
ncbi:MAG: HD domain-containing protein [Proteiniphilum sp.]|jgi:putative hydrolase of HD superfamily|nr:HD domain-containing protein [Proteiniphilum sp.]NCB25902.1 HD domain-containing protein [Bacteroidia bacterium]MDD2938049.1 HD domain-containing protein [Proteiniphilum sp.]MDD3076246.1 HD domain-containing protein [Proteiniphilum sp.]MDD3780927.1 HD domain-containing protein [Proteiniphilum sp.]